MNNSELWQSVLAQMQFHISKANFATWFKNTEIISKKEEKIIISVPNAFSKESPARVGAWVGWQIVKKYMANNKNVTLPQLLDDYDAQNILSLSGYKPKK